MSEISKVISKIYVWNNENKCNTVVAEVIENPGMGFEWLIRIDPEYQNDIEVFEKCLKICKWDFPNVANGSEEWNLKYINKSYERGYIMDCQEIALISDKVI